MNKVKRWWLQLRRKEILFHGAIEDSAEATDDRLASSGGYIGPGTALGGIPGASPISAMGNLEPMSTSPLGDTSGALAEDFPNLDTGRTGVAHADAATQGTELDRINAELGIPPDSPDHTGKALEKDVEEHAGSIEKWREEDEKAGRVI